MTKQPGGILIAAGDFNQTRPQNCFRLNSISISNSGEANDMCHVWDRATHTLNIMTIICPWLVWKQSVSHWEFTLKPDECFFFRYCMWNIAASFKLWKFAWEKLCREREQGYKKKKLSSDYNYGTWHLADFKSGRPNFTKAVNGGSKLARSLPNQKFALYNFTQSDFSTVIQCNQVIRGEH